MLLMNNIIHKVTGYFCERKERCVNFDKVIPVVGADASFKLIDNICYMRLNGDIFELNKFEIDQWLKLEHRASPNDAGFSEVSTNGIDLILWPIRNKTTVLFSKSLFYMLAKQFDCSIHHT